MDKKDFDFDGLRNRLGRFWRAPVELLIGTIVTVTAAGILAVASSYGRPGYNPANHPDLSGFHIAGVVLWFTLTAYGAALLCRIRPSFNIPRPYCDAAAYLLTLLSLVRITLFLVIPANTYGNTFHVLSAFHFYLLPGPGIMFLLAAPILLWRAASVRPSPKTAVFYDPSAPMIIVPLPKTDIETPHARNRSE